MENEIHKKVEELREYFSSRDEVLLAYLFGSRARLASAREDGNESDPIHAHSDWDIAVYFKPRNGELEYQSAEYYDEETEIQIDLARILKKDVDLVVINRAPATIVFSSLRGISLLQKDYFSYSTLLMKSMFDAIDYRDVVYDYFKIAMRSQSLNPIDKDRLAKIATFLIVELRDLEKLSKMGQLTYQQDRDKQRSLDRCTENAANAAIDSAKILLASNHISLPETYEEMLLGLRALPDFDTTHATTLSRCAGMRNILAHHYLDLRFRGIISFVNKSLPSLLYLCSFIEKSIDDNT